MKKQALVIGLGQFGAALARSLTRNGLDVLAVDSRPELVAQVADDVTEAIALDAMDDQELARLAPNRRDLAICSIGESREASIIVTALLRQLGAPRIVARATDPLHARILHLVGAHEVVQPEAHFGERLAARLAFSHVVDLLPLGNDLVISELKAPPSFAGRTLAELDLPGRFQVTVVAVRRGMGGLIEPRGPTRIEVGDTLVIVGPPEGARRALGSV
jgi:trk system potassium uptake protein TrkA